MAGGVVDIIFAEKVKKDIIEVNSGLKEALATILEFNKQNRQDNTKNVNGPKDLTTQINKNKEAVTQLNKVVEESNRLNAKLVASEKALTDARSKTNIEIVKNRYETQILNKQTKEAAILSSKLSSEYSKLVVKMNQAGSSVQNLTAKKLQGIQLSNKEQQELKESQLQFLRYQKAVLGADASVGRFQRNVGNYPRALGAAASAVRSLAGAMGLMSAAFLFVSVMRSALNTIIEFDRQLIAVGKTTGIVGQDLKNFGTEVIQLGIKLKGISTKDLLKASEIAGQLGIKGSDNILKFSTTIEKLRLTSNIAGEESARAFAKFIEVSSDSVENADRLGSVITQLGNNFATTESEILKNTTEIQKGIAIYATSAQGVLALGAATNALGGEAEASRGAMQRTFRTLNEAATQGVHLEKILKLTGQTAAEFKEEFGRDAIAVFDKFVKGLSLSAKEGKNLSLTLTELGLDELRVSAVVGSLATNYSTLENALKMANEEYINNAALNKEAEMASQSLSSNIGDLGDAWDNLVLTVEKGEGSIATSFKGFIGFLTMLVSKTEELERAQSKVFMSTNRTGSGFWGFIQKTLPGVSLLSTGYDKLVEKQKEFNKTNENIELNGLETLRGMLGRISREITTNKDLNKDMITLYTSQATHIAEVIAKKQEERKVLEETAVLNGFIVEEIYGKISNYTDEDLKKYINANEKKTKSAEELAEDEINNAKKVQNYLKGSIGYLNEMIAANNALIDQATDRGTIEKLQKENELLEIQKNLLLNGAKAKQTLIDAASAGSNGSAVETALPGTILEQDKVTASGFALAMSDVEDFLVDYEDQIQAGIDLTNSFFDNKIQRIDDEIKANENKYAVLLAAAGDDQIQRDLLEAEFEKKKQALEKKRQKEARKQAIFNKALALSEIVINTAIAVSKVAAQTGIFAAAGIGPILILGALQAAAVLAQPIPKYKYGTHSHKGGAAIVGDGGVNEYTVSPSGEVGITPNTPTLVNLEKGTKVYPNFEKFKAETTDFTGMVYNASVMASLSIDQKNLSKYIESQKALDKQILRELQTGNQILKSKKMQANFKQSKVDFNHELFRLKNTNWNA